MRHNQLAFTLVELMIVIVIIGILLAIAIPQYQQYVVRSKITEGLQLASVVKIAVAEYYLINDKFPISNHEAGIAEKIQGKYVQNIVVGENGVISIDYADIIQSAKQNILTLTPQSDNGTIAWNCSGTMEEQYRPAGCRD
jgi:prepilin-type N-terminal cleavage/methylation domain-containing protein